MIDQVCGDPTGGAFTGDFAIAGPPGYVGQKRRTSA
jgi:hypothetical protein